MANDPSTSRYKSEWKPNSLNEEFWREVLVGRTIVDVVFDADGITAFKLDDGQVVGLKGYLSSGARVRLENELRGTLFVED